VLPVVTHVTAKVCLLKVSKPVTIIRLPTSSLFPGEKLKIHKQLSVISHQLSDEYFLCQLIAES
jgi:hypothetical protein